MYVQAKDNRPPSLLATEAFTFSMLAGGMAVSLGAHLAVSGAVSALLSVLAVASIGAGDQQPPLKELHVVEARFVRLGKKRDPRKLPNRIVPIKSTAPETGVAVSKKLDPDRAKNRPDDKDRPPNAAEDLLTRLGTRAQTFAEIAEEREREGDPEGVEWGTADEGQEGDIYRGKLVAFFQRGWTLPTTLNREAVRSLITKVSVQITPAGQVGAFEIIGPSGNPLFDQSVNDRLQQLRHLKVSVPEPPPEVASQFIGQTIAVRFLGRNAR